jgi:hypothetical protein
MMVKQISVFIENKKGRLYKLTKALGDEGIDLIALSIADTTNFGILRCIVNDPEKALKVLKEAGFTANTTEVLAVEVPDIPGGLASVLDILTSADISVEYLYSFVRTKSDSALILFRVEEIEKAIEVLKKNNINILSNQDVYNI